MKYFPKISAFLEYFPFELDTNKLLGKLKQYRFINGLTQNACTQILGVDAGGLSCYKTGYITPHVKSLKSFLAKREYFS
ncbi:hypothetical protein GO495_08200 [Chitinophaga oryziterrae]|uniref:Uncharacterized protein n=1 Tax=Chitinophaga oryziterrae TaxID=1031224 RepID=A0A6N8J7G1_9BACT|nr:hypothetical protein [Chitinophaga oryziterrae]MVT40561.1 hypothetical protein [Chitinophaga oryziterrae]